MSRLTLTLSTVVLMLLLSQQSSVNGLRVLGLFFHPGLSHFNFFHPVLRGLAEAGHEVTVVSHFPDSNPPKNYTDLSLPEAEVLVNVIDFNQFSYRPKIGHFIEFFSIVYKWGLDSCEAALNSEVIQNLLNSTQPYDVILTEQFNSDCSTAVGWKLQAPIIALSSCSLLPWHYNRFGIPANPSYIPVLHLGLSDKMSFLERLSNWITVHGLNFLYKTLVERNTDLMLRKYFQDDNMPYLGEIVKNTSLMFLNTHYSLSGSKPSTPAIIEIGGVHIQKSKPLDPELQQILDDSENGVIYISWGSMLKAQSLPAGKRNSLLEALGSLKQTVLWKWENDTIPNKPANVIIRKWMPQREILCHPNVRVFLSHGGLLGLSEAAYCGVATVLTPMYGDQFLNAAALVNRGMGTIVEYEEFSTENIREAIRKALDPETQAKAKMVSYSYRNRPQNALETAIWWVEYVAATKGAYLTKSYAPYLSIISYYCLDIYATIFAFLIICISSWVYVIKMCCSRKRSQIKTKVQ